MPEKDLRDPGTGTTLIHLAITGTDAQGKNVEWMEKVGDDPYSGH